MSLLIPLLIAATAVSTTVAGMALLWLSTERQERKISNAERLSLQSRNEQLSNASIELIKSHSSQLVKTEERHLLIHDSSVRNILDSLERAASNMPKR